MFFRVCTKLLNPKISWTRWIKSVYAYYFSKNHSVLSSNSSHSLHVSLCFWGFPFKNLYSFVVSLIRATWPSHYILHLKIPIHYTVSRSILHKVPYYVYITIRVYNKHRLVSSYKLNAHFVYSITIYMLHYNPQHVSSSTLLIFRRTNCIITASGIVILCKQPYSMPVESGLQYTDIHVHEIAILSEV